MALTAERSTEMKVTPAPKNRPVAAAKKLFKGGLIMSSAGYATPGATVTGAIALGRSRKTYDNSSGSAGDIVAEVEEGTFRWTNGDSIAQADVGKPAYITDDDAVTKAGTGKSPAGIIVDVDSVGVWVEMSEAISKGLLAAGAAASGGGIQTGTVTLVAGVGTVTTGITITAASKIFVTMNTPAGTLGTWGYKVADADLTVGVPDTGEFKIRSIDENGSAATSDTSTVNWLIVG